MLEIAGEINCETTPALGVNVGAGVRAFIVL
jgi:hypothetical protein